MAIKRNDVFTFKYFEYGEMFHGSYRGMRYQLGRDPLEVVWFKSPQEKAEGRIKAWVWPEPLAFDKTDDDKKIDKEFEFSEKGVSSAVDWINEMWEEHYSKN